jgi:hypothetical protein
VAQRSAYLLTKGVSWLVIDLALIILGFVLVWRSRKGPFDDEGLPTLHLGGLVLGMVMLVITILTVGSEVIPTIAEGISPLGRVLEVLK